MAQAPDMNRIPARAERVITFRRLLAAGATLAMGWLLGFAWFLHLASLEVPRMRHADGIVVLTGGPERVEVALRLLSGGTADRLLVSGAGEKTDLADLAQLAKLDPTPLEHQVTLGHAAHSTRGNALETATWAREQRVGSLLVVTAWFHMPRAMIELRRTLASVTPHPYPVGRLVAADLTHGPMAWRVISEYHKYLAAAAGITASRYLTAASGVDTAG
jgi:uncharacterized SAM-binding protein YcdF (DUF218 family)